MSQLGRSIHVRVRSKYTHTGQCSDLSSQFFFLNELNKKPGNDGRKCKHKYLSLFSFFKKKLCESDVDRSHLSLMEYPITKPNPHTELSI